MKRTILLVVLISIAVPSGFLICDFTKRASSKGISMGYYGTGMDYKQQKNNIMAIAYLNKSIALNADSWITHLALAETYLAIDEYKYALDEYELTRSLLEGSGGSRGEIERIQRSIDKVKVIMKERKINTGG
jgi:tetratricopeptide (TPR) repeat protein